MWVKKSFLCYGRSGTKSNHFWHWTFLRLFLRLTLYWHAERAFVLQQLNTLVSYSKLSWICLEVALTDMVEEMRKPPGGRLLRVGSRRQPGIQQSPWPGCRGGLHAFLPFLPTSVFLFLSSFLSLRLCIPTELAQQWAPPAWSIEPPQHHAMAATGPTTLIHVLALNIDPNVAFALANAFQTRLQFICCGVRLPNPFPSGVRL